MFYFSVNIIKFLPNQNEKFNEESEVSAFLKSQGSSRRGRNRRRGRNSKKEDSGIMKKEIRENKANMAPFAFT